MGFGIEKGPLSDFGYSESSPNTRPDLMQIQNTDSPAQESHQRAQAIGDRAEAIEGVRRGLASMERSEGRPAGEVFEEIRERHDIPRQV